MKKIACKDCIHYINHICMYRHTELPLDCNICQFFRDKEGKSPRFCKLTNDVDRLAMLMVFDSRAAGESIGFEIRPTNKIYPTAMDAFNAAKEWLMELE